MGHAIFLYLPGGKPAELFVGAAMDLAGEGGYLEDSFIFDDGEQYYEIAAPNLIPGNGLKKPLALNLTAFKNLATELDLALEAYLVVAKPLFLLDFTLKEYGFGGLPILPEGDDFWEIWWEIPLQEDPVLLADLVLALDLSLPVFSPVLVLVLWILGMAAAHRKKPSIWSSRWQLPLINGVMILVIAFCLEFFGWLPLLRYVYPGFPQGAAGMVGIAVASYLSSQLVSAYMKARVQNPSFKLKGLIPLYSLTLLYFLYIGLLLLAGLWLWPHLAALSPWLGVAVFLAAAPSLYGNGIVLIFFLLGARHIQDPTDLAFMEAVTDKLGVPVGRKLMVPAKKCRVALAAYINFPSSPLVSEYLWENTDQDEQAFILAHELAHVKLGFDLHIWAVRICAWIVVLSFVLSDWLKINPTLSLLGGLVVVWLVQYFILFPRLRRMEGKADQLALSYTQSPAAAASALDKLEKLNSHFNVNQRTTHPTMEERIKALQRDRV